MQQSQQLKGSNNSKLNSLFFPDQKFKIVLVGESFVGKTSIFRRYTTNRFVSYKESNSLIDDDFKGSNISLKKNFTLVDYKTKNILVGQEMIVLNIWDTAGQERYRSMVTTYFKGCHGIVLVFDITNKDSFQALINSWIPICKEQVTEEHCIFSLVGNKSDLEEERKVSEVEAQELALKIKIDLKLKHDVKYHEVSALKNMNLEESFLNLATQIKDVYCERFLKTQYSEFEHMERMYDGNPYEPKVLYGYYGEGKDQIFAQSFKISGDQKNGNLDISISSISQNNNNVENNKKKKRRGCCGQQQQ